MARSQTTGENKVKQIQNKYHISNDFGKTRAANSVIAVRIIPNDLRYHVIRNHSVTNNKLEING